MKTRCRIWINNIKCCIALVALLVSHSLYCFNAYSTEELEELEKEFARLINQSDQLERHPLVIQYINRLGKNLSRDVRMHTPYFFVVKSNEINAFAGPGGYIGINTRLILATENESELAAVMAHEIAHVRLHHLYRMIQHEKQMRVPMLASMLASVALGMINPALASGAMMASMTGFAQDSINFTRASEKEADRIGIQMLTHAGFDPRGMPGFFKKMQEAMRYYYHDDIPAILRTHPLDEDRIAEAENRIHHPKTHQDSLDYALFREIIRNTTKDDHKDLLDYYQKTCRNKTYPEACEYGKALALIGHQEQAKARSILEKLLQARPDNVFYRLANADANKGLKQSHTAINDLINLYDNDKNSYAVLLNLGQSLMDAGQPGKARQYLLKATRRYPKDLRLCDILAQAEAKSGRIGYAYFTKAHCYALQGLYLDAKRQLEQAQRFAGQDKYLRARIEARLDEVQEARKP